MAPQLRPGSPAAHFHRIFLPVCLCCLTGSSGIVINAACVGTWTKQWKKEQGALPERVLTVLNHSASPRLFQVFERHECPFGIALPGDVTWPRPPKGLENAVGEMDYLTFAMVVWSFVPYLVVLYMALCFALSMGTREFSALSWVLFFVAANEIVIKRLAHQPRPGTFLEVRDYDGKLRGSCVSSCGMPSSHAGVTTGLFVLIFLDAALRVRQRRPTRSQSRAKSIQDDYKECLRVLLQGSCFSPTYNRTFSHFEFIIYIGFWVLVLVPSSLARIVLYDHTAEQVIMGKLVGIALALCWWWFVRCLQYSFGNRLDKRICGLLHNHPLPDQPSAHLDSEAESGDRSSESSASPGSE